MVKTDMAGQNSLMSLKIKSEMSSHNSEKSSVGGSARTECKMTDGMTETVVVYLDRAEVTRNFKIGVRQGENEVILTDLSTSIDKDSIRVEGRGSATILEVAFQTTQLTPSNDTDRQSKEEKLRKQLSDANKKKELLQLKETRLRKQRQVLDGFADNAMRGAGVNTNNSDSTENASFLSKDNLVGMTAFLELFDRHTDKLDVSLHFLKTDIENCSKQITSLQKSLQSLNAEQEKKETSQLCVLLDAHEASDITLCISYVVSKAKWTPKYDIRVFGSEQQLKIQYYGIIQQATGEDWLDAKLCLSTATPSVGGTIPTLGTQKLQFKPRPIYKKRHRSFAVKESRMTSMPRLSYHADMPQENTFCELAMNPAHELDLEVAETEVKDSIATTMYEIARRATVPCDNVGHKVTVAILDLKPTFEHQCVPRVSTNAFLKGRVRNTSPYALLAGPTNVFLDNNFVAKSELKAVSPGEEFTCSLGVDPAVKVEYKPLHKYREQSGIISKTTSITYKQVIEIKNTQKDAIKILVSDHLPLSTEEKIKVTLQEPTIKHPERYDVSRPVRLSPANNIEWDLEIQPGEARELLLRYNVEHPSSETLDTQVTDVSKAVTTTDL